ncbi:UNVERIFIED_CONTAM: hypothetical protein Sradi_3015100 [Sesamum radiatum]|uniref:Uncharacterized protein n=1 Tax=Sesamum radiatum TaxID=300843 RepID=A0AAW2S3K4_SESRA
MMSFTELPPSFLSYALEAAAKLLNMAPSKTVPQTPYEIWHVNPAFYKYLRVSGSPAYVRRLVRDKLNSRSTRESRPSERYEFLGLTSQLDNDPRTYGEVMSGIDSDKWLEAMKSEMDSMGSNQVWTLVDPPKDVRTIEMGPDYGILVEGLAFIKNEPTSGNCVMSCSSCIRECQLWTVLDRTVRFLLEHTF